MKLYVVTDVRCNFQLATYHTQTYYFLSEELAISKIEELHTCGDDSYAKKYRGDGLHIPQHRQYD